MDTSSSLGVAFNDKLRQNDSVQPNLHAADSLQCWQMQAHLPALQTNENGSQTESGSRLQIDGADGGTRTRTDLSIQRILSPLRLPFRHIGARPDLQ
jgi:hypothetical protein